MIARGPSGMWWRTFVYKRDEIERCENQANIVFLSNYSPAFSRKELEMFFDR